MASEETKLVLTNKVPDSQESVSSKNGLSVPSFDGLRNEILTTGGGVLLTLLLGYSIGFASPASLSLVNEGKMTESQTNWFASLLFLGALLGCILAFLSVDYLGLKLQLMCSAVISAIGWWLIVSNFHISLLLIGRALCGISFGIAAPLNSTYLIETLSEKTRATAMSICGLTVSVGTLLCFFFSIILPWRWLSLTALCFCAAYIIAMYFLPESPRWLMAHGRVDEAKQSLSWLRMGNTAIFETELSAIEKSCSYNAMKSFKINEIIHERKHHKPFLLCGVIILGLIFSCHSAIIAYLQQILIDIGVENWQVASLGLSFVQVVTSFVIVIIANRAERRMFLTVGGTLISVALFLFGLLDFLERVFLLNIANWLTIIILMVYFIGYNASWHVFAYVAMNEICPQSIRGQVVSFAFAINNVGFFVSTFTLRPLETLICPWGTFLIYVIFHTLSTVAVALYLPDTKMMTLEEIELNFN